MEKYTMVGIGLGYLAFGPVRGLVMADDGQVPIYEARVDMSVSDVVNFQFDDVEYIAAAEVLVPLVEDDIVAVQEPSHKYLVTASDDGYIVVYNVYPGDKQGGTIREVTTTTIDALAPEEQALLLGGIRVYTEEALVRILEDYGS